MASLTTTNQLTVLEELNSLLLDSNVDKIRTLLNTNNNLHTVIDKIIDTKDKNLLQQIVCFIDKNMLNECEKYLKDKKANHQKIFDEKLKDLREYEDYESDLLYKARDYLYCYKFSDEAACKAISYDGMLLQKNYIKADLAHTKKKITALELKIESFSNIVYYVGRMFYNRWFELVILNDNVSDESSDSEFLSDSDAEFSSDSDAEFSSESNE